MAAWYESLIKDEDFQEEEVWAFGNEREESNSEANKCQKLKRYSMSSSYACTSLDGVGAPRAILKGCRVPHYPNQQQQQSSAPIRIPDWSKIHRQYTKVSSDGCYEDDHDDNGIHDGDDEMMPPHEYINRRVARSQIAPFSMCEGVGRTLKGRDLSILRNIILTKTGFLE